MNPANIEAMLLRAQEEEIGLAIKTNNTQRMQMALSDFVRGNERFSDLMFCLPSLPDLVFIVKKSVELPE
jgi:hypothetical protein